MNIKTTLTLLIVLLIIVVSIAIFIPQLIPPQVAVEPLNQNSTNQTKSESPKTAVDLEVDNIINSLQTEQTIIVQDDQDANSVKTDLNIINTLGDVYNADEL
jgi:hypothetical protein